MRHAEKAVAAGVDGLVLLTAGAGGQTGWANPCRAGGEEVLGRDRRDGGRYGGRPAVAAAQALGCDLVTWAPNSSPRARALAKGAYKQMLVSSRLDDVLLTRAFTGLETNMLRR